MADVAGTGRGPNRGHAQSAAHDFRPGRWLLEFAWDRRALTSSRDLETCPHYAHVWLSPEVLCVLMHRAAPRGPAQCRASGRISLALAAVECSPMASHGCTRRRRLSSHRTLEQATSMLQCCAQKQPCVLHDRQPICDAAYSLFARGTHAGSLARARCCWRPTGVTTFPAAFACTLIDASRCTGAHPAGGRFVASGVLDTEQTLFRSLAEHEHTPTCEF